MLIAHKIKKDHQEINQQLQELENIMLQSEINYSNLIQTFSRLIKLWDPHEKAEEYFFHKLKQQNYPIPYEKILFEHGLLQKYKHEIKDALKSGSESQLKSALDASGKNMISELKAHMSKEDDFLANIPEHI